MERKAIFEFSALAILSITLILQFYISFSSTDAHFYTAVKLSTFFTIQTNLLLWLSFLSVSLFRYQNLGKFFSKPTVMTALLTYGTIVCIVYHILLIKVWNPQGLQWYVGELLHKINPLLILLYWVFFVPKSDLNYNSVLIWLAFPILYFIYVMLLGATGLLNFPYPFLNPNKVGLITVMIYGGSILSFFAFCSCTYIYFAKLLEKQKIR